MTNTEPPSVHLAEEAPRPGRKSPKAPKVKRAYFDPDELVRLESREAEEPFRGL